MPTGFRSVYMWAMLDLKSPMDYMDQREIIGNLKLLTSFQPDGGVSVTSIQDVLKDILKKFRSSPAESEEYGQQRVDQEKIIDSYVRSLMDQLCSLAEAMVSQEIDPSRPLLSVNECNQVKRAVEFLIGFGVSPLLEPGLIEFCWKQHPGAASLEDSKRRFAKDLLDLATKTTSSEPGDKERHRFEKLGSCVDCLFRLWECSSFKALITSNFLGYLLASLFQLTSIPSEGNADDVLKYKSYLKKIIDGTYPPTMLRQLMALQAKKSTYNSAGKVTPPTWFLSACVRLLSEFIMEPRGILIFLRTLDDVDGGANSLNENWQRCESLATLVSSRPRSAAGRDPSTYYENVCDQLAADEEILNRYSRFFALVVQKLYSKCRPAVQARILDPIFAALGACSDSNASVPPEEQLTRAIEHLKVLYASVPVEASFVESLSQDRVLILLRMYFDIRNTISYCRTPLIEIIRAYVENADRASAISVVKDWLLLLHPSSVHFAPGASGGVILRREVNKNVTDLQERIEVLHQLIGDSPKEFLSRLFDDCLEMIIDDGCHNATPSTSTSTVGAAGSDPFETLSILSFVVSLLEWDANLGSSNRTRMIKLLKTLLEKHADGDSHGEELESLKTQNLHLVLGLVGALFSSGEALDTESEEEAILDLKTTLQHLSDSHPDANVCSAAKDIVYLLSASTDKKNLSPSSAAASVHEEYRYSNYDQAMLDLQHPLIPVRAHALTALANLIKSKDAVTCSKIDSLIPVFIDRLEEDDSYVYLAAVNCLSAAGLFRPNVVLPVLMAIFKRASDGKTDSLDLRLKTGEAVVKISQGLGDLAPFYGNDLINGFLSILREGDDEVKASCLANVAEICRLMAFRLNAYIRELFYCAKQLLLSEKTPLVRRAAINLLALLAESGDSFLEVLGDLSRDYYRFVKDVYEHDDDDIVRLHAQKCLENLGDHVRKFLKPLIVPVE